MQRGDLHGEIGGERGAAAGQHRDGPGVAAAARSVIGTCHDRVHHHIAGKARRDAGLRELRRKDGVARQHELGAAPQQGAFEGGVAVGVAGFVDVEIEAGAPAAQPAHDDAEQIADDQNGVVVARLMAHEAHGGADAEAGDGVAQQREAAALALARQVAARPDQRADAVIGAAVAQRRIGGDGNLRRQAAHDLGGDGVLAVAIGDDEKLSHRHAYLPERPWRR